MNKQSINKIIFSNYSQLGKKFEINKINSGPNSNLYLISSKKGKYILKNFQDLSNSKKIEQICLILNKIKNTAKVEEPIKNDKGFFVDRKSRTYLTKFYHGNTGIKNKKQYLDLAKNLSILHISLKKLTKFFPFHDKKNLYKILTPDEINKISNQINNKNQLNRLDRKVKNDIFIIKNSIKKLKQMHKQISKDLPSIQLIHFDLHPGNVLFSENKISKIVDFNTIQYGYVLEDAIYCGFRFGIEISKTPHLLKKNIDEFIHVYSKSLKSSKNFSIAEYFLLKRILNSISYLLKANYFFNINTWNKDYEKFIKFLRIVLEIY